MMTTPSKAILGVQNVAKDYGSQPVLRDVSLTIQEGDRLGLMGNIRTSMT
jgi:ATPase subunit of ABC transporter with duplicated ATPase domains